MPWRECIFTDARVVHQASSYMITWRARDISKPQVQLALPDAASSVPTPPQDSSDLKIASPLASPLKTRTICSRNSSQEGLAAGVDIGAVAGIGARVSHQGSDCEKALPQNGSVSWS